MPAYRAPDAAAWRDTAVRAEEMGYSVLLLADHFKDQLAPFSALSAAACATTRIRLGALVFANDFRHPAVLAKEAATIDLLSDGRLELGIGAGWAVSDYEATGIPYESPRVRIERLEESVTIIKTLLAEESCSFAGKHYSVHNLDGLPRPVQRPHPPLLIAGGGPRILALAGREANIAGLNFRLTPTGAWPNGAAEMTPEATHRKIRRVAESAGRRFSEIELNILLYWFEETPTPAKAAAALAAEWNVSPAEILASPYFLLGSQEQVIDTLERRREEFGISYIVVNSKSAESFAPVVAALTGR